MYYSYFGSYLNEYGRFCTYNGYQVNKLIKIIIAQSRVVIALSRVIVIALSRVIVIALTELN